jgi:MoaA/NifB/PqqE/SkfB family radical SAM enzyme
MKNLKSTELAAKGFRFLLRRPTAKEIMWLNFAVTYLCNSRCVMCSIWNKYRENPELAKHELQLSEIETLLESNYLRRLQGISFTGGEPFLRKDIVDLVGLFIERYPQALIGIATNGLNPTLIVRKMDEIFSIYKPNQHISISISLDGIGATHDEMRGIPQAYDRVLETVEALQERFSVNIGVDFTITPQNYRELLNVYHLSKDKGIKFLAPV